MQSKITLIGMYNYDNTLFDELNFPAGIDKNLAISRILNKSEEFEVLYSDFDYLKDRIGIWGEIWERTFDKWIKALSIDYDPLYNYDRTETYTDTHARQYADGQSENSKSSSNTATGSQTKSITEQQVSAYDGEGYSDKTKEDAGAFTNQTGNGSAEGKITRDASGTSNDVTQHSAHLFGNIGVTTSQQMLADELKIAEWNLYEHISDIFIDEFCILVY